MTHISKHELSAPDFEKLYARLHFIISLLNKNTSRNFFDALLTKTEQIMLTKRLCAILMIHEQYSNYKVATTLLMSESTVKMIKLKYHEGAFIDITRILDADEQARAEFWLTVDKVLRMGMPSMGKNRWKGVL